MKLRRVISGGQSGVDLAALDVAKSLNYETGGWIPRGFLTEDGSRPHYAGLYGVRETDESEYPARTRRNILDADHTLILSVGRPTGGTALTARLCGGFRRTHTVVDLARADADMVAFVRDTLASLGVETLNVAGSRESKNPGVYDMAAAFLLEVLRR